MTIRTRTTFEAKMEKAAVKKKRKRSVLTLEMKLSTIIELEKGSSQGAVGESFGVPKSTVADIWKDRNKIIDALVLPTLKRCIVRLPKFDLVDESCWKWFCQQRSKGAPVSGVLLQEKARSFFGKLFPDADSYSFKASMGWLTKFNGIKNVQLRGEILSYDTAAINPFREHFTKVIEEESYSLQQIYNADETGLWWRMMPSYSLNSSRVTRASNFKKAKDRVTILGCANASGNHRLPLVFINKSAKPRCFKHTDMTRLPVHYYSQAKSWMDSKIFKDWFHVRFVSSVRKFCGEHGLKKKALLLLDNAPSHPSMESL